jgi:hypothetical protein
MESSASSSPGRAMPSGRRKAHSDHCVLSVPDCDSLDLDHGSRLAVVNMASLKRPPNGAEATAKTGLRPPFTNELEM